MHVFIDESGIHKSVDHCAIAFIYVCFENKDEIEKEIVDIENNLGISHFHWSNFGSKKAIGQQSELLDLFHCWKRKKPSS